MKYSNPNNPNQVKLLTSRMKMIIVRFFAYSIEDRRRGLFIGGLKLRCNSNPDEGYLVPEGFNELWSEVIFFKKN